ncbi:MAG: hypothetical protein K9N01_00340 [Cephaloticoccus sp.]|nr:hypothetical protein [Cephaloticoccus sp.]
MKKIATFSLLAAALLTLTPRPAVASDRGLAVLGGFIGGVLIANAINNQPHYDTVVMGSSCPPPVIVVENNQGYWQESPIQIWIGPAWTVVYDNYHRPIRRFTPGHYVTRVNRVWIAGSSRPAHYSHYDRGRDHDRRYVSDRRDSRKNRRDRH